MIVLLLMYGSLYVYIYICFLVVVMFFLFVVGGLWDRFPRCVKGPHDINVRLRSALPSRRHPFCSQRLYLVIPEFPIRRCLEEHAGPGVLGIPVPFLWRFLTSWRSRIIMRRMRDIISYLILLSASQTKCQASCHNAASCSIRLP